jgi:hypothetical protein
MSDAIMKARQLIDGASFGPDALKAIGQTFDKAWLEIAGNFGDDIERAEYASDHPRGMRLATLACVRQELRNRAFFRLLRDRLPPSTELGNATTTKSLPSDQCQCAANR